MSNEAFERATEDWESHDDWMFADKLAMRKHFYEAGQNQRNEEVKELEEEVDTCYSYRDQVGDMRVRAEKAEARVNELKRKLFNEGVKNNSDKARTEFLDDKLKDVEKVIEAARVLAVHLRKGGYTGTMFQDVLKAVDALDIEGGK